MYRLLYLFAFCAAFVLSQAAKTPKAYAQTPPIEKPVKKTDFPIVGGAVLPFIVSEWQGYPVVQFRINDKVDAKFLVDTGTNVSIISPAIVKQLGLRLKKQSRAQGVDPGDPAAQVNYVSVDKLNAGDLTLQGDLVVLNTAPGSIAPGSTKTPYDGVLGGNFLSQFAVLLDFAANTIFVIPNGKLTDAQVRFLDNTWSAASAIPLKSAGFNDTRVTVPVFLDGANGLDAIIDTGARATMLLNSDKKIKIPSNTEGVTQSFEWFEPPGRSWEFTRYTFGIFGAGKSAASVGYNAVADFEGGIISSDAKDADTILGLDYLSQFRVLLDYPAHRLYLRPLYNPKYRRFPSETSRQSAAVSFADVTLIPSDTDQWTVLSTENDGIFGKAGIKKADIIEKVNGQNVTGKGFVTIYNLLYKRDDYADLQILRDGKPVTVRVNRSKQKAK